MQIDAYKTKLEEEKKLIESELNSMGKQDKETGDWEATPEEQTSPESDENDMADRAEDYQERSSTTDVLNKRLDDIDNALLKIHNRTYGVCEICKMVIEKERLDANASARTCMGCINNI